MRVVLFHGLALAALGVLGAAGAASTTQPAPAQAIYVVRPDPRACPSPFCGGYWVALANHARTRCADGLLRPRCYVASALDAGGQTWPKPLAAGALVAGRLAARSFGQLGDLGVIVAGEEWSPADTRPAHGRFFGVRDTGVRCVRRPCFSYRADELNSRRAVRLSGVVLGRAGTDPDVRAYSRLALRTREGLLAAGAFGSVADGGRVFLASQLYLRR